MKSGRKWLASLMALVMLTGTLSITAFADTQDNDANSNAGDTVQWDISKSKEATNLDENFESDVTLSLPAGDYKGDLDVVFVLDGSTSTDEDALAENAAELLEDLADFENLNVKAGLVVFGGSVPILYKNDELLVLSEDDNLDTIKAAITDKSYDGIAGRSGSNLQAGVKAAQELLDADEAVDNADKYLILLTDGGARMWVNDKGGGAVPDVRSERQYLLELE